MIAALKRAPAGSGLALALLLVVFLIIRPAQGQTLPNVTPQTLTDAQVLNAITHGVDYLVNDLDKRLTPLKKLPNTQRADRQSLGDPGTFMLEAYSLLYVGANTRDARLSLHEERMEILEDILIRGDYNETYTAALQSLALAQLSATPDVRRAITRVATKLVRGRGVTGGYSYQLSATETRHDQSNSQYGLLGVWASADFGVVVPQSYWRSTDEFWRGIQAPNGGWSYTEDTPSPAMTAAGVASLYVCDEFLNRTATLQPRTDAALAKGLAAMENEFAPQSNNFYYLYGVERAALASGSKFFGNHDWYREMAANIVKLQGPDGHFTGSFIGADDIHSTCYAILLLARGRAPVIMNKLQYAGPWNSRSRDSANLHAYLGKNFERHLNWQVVPLDSPVEEWLDAPILLITGSKDPAFTEAEVTKLRQFANAGGIIFSVADGESREFSEAMAKYASQMITPDRRPTPDNAFRELPPDHPLYSVYAKMPNPPKLMGISNGIRELWVHSPQDYGAVWQSYDLNQKDAWDVPAALFFYMAGKDGLRSRLQALSLPAPSKKPDRRTSVARLQYAGNWDPEPGAWPRLAKLMATTAATDVTIKHVSITALPGMAEMPALAHLTGSAKVTFSGEEQNALRDYINAGGTLFIEAIGGKQEFAASARELIASLCPDGRIKTVPSDYMLYTGAFSADATAINEVEYRRGWTLEHGRVTIPRLEYMTLNHRVAIFFSAEDITSGLLGTNGWGISGYAPDSAIAIARNMVLYAWRNLPKKKPPTTRH